MSRVGLEPVPTLKAGCLTSVAQLGWACDGPGSHVTSLSALLMSLEQGLRASPGDASGAEASTPSTWLREARSVPWKQIAPRVPESPGRSPSFCKTLRGTPRAAFLARARRGALALCSDVSVLAATVRGGTLLEQRAALARLTVLARQRSASEASIDPEVVAREPELERDVLHWLSEQGGATAREARSTLAEVAQLMARSEARLRASVQGVQGNAPLDDLEPHERASLTLHLRGASHFVVGCLVDELLESLDEGDSRTSARLLYGLRFAADPRLLPALAGILLDNADLSVRAEAAGALARIDDPRVSPLLHLAYQTASAREERVALVEALGLQGEIKDSAFLREALDYYDSHFDRERPQTDDVREPPSSGSRSRGPAALVRALDAIFDPSLVEAALRFASHENAEVQRAAVRAIGRVGDDMALAWFERIDERIPDGLEAELEAARSAIFSRIELRGEKAEQNPDPERIGKLRKALARKFSRGLDVTPTKRHRALAWLLMFRAVVFFTFGGREAASKLAYLAHQADPGWHYPPLFQGRLWHRTGDGSRAIAGYRRALAVAPRRLFRRTRWVTPIVSAFVKRAERLLSAGHAVRAARLLDELWPYDVSRAAPPVRIALNRCRQHLALPGVARGEPELEPDQPETERP